MSNTYFQGEAKHFPGGASPSCTPSYGPDDKPLLLLHMSKLQNIAMLRNDAFLQTGVSVGFVFP